MAFECFKQMLGIYVDGYHILIVIFERLDDYVSYVFLSSWAFEMSILYLDFCLVWYELSYGMLFYAFRKRYCL